MSRNARLILLIAVLLGGCGGDVAEPDELPLELLAGDWILESCTTVRTTNPSAMGICRSGDLLTVNSEGAFELQPFYLPGEDAPPLVRGRFTGDGFDIRVTIYQARYKVIVFQGARMQWSRTGTAVFPPSTVEEPATIYQSWTH